MGFFSRTASRMLWSIIERSERRSSLENPQTPLSFPAEWLLDIFNGGRTDSGIRVSEMTALQCDAVLAAVKIICSGIASLPLHVYERQTRDNRLAKRVAHDHDLYDVLRHSPNPEMTSHDWRGVIMAHALLWGNSYTEIQRDNGNNIVALWPRNPARTRPVRLTHDATIEGTLYRAGTLVFHTSEIAGDEVITAEDDSGNRMAAERIVLAEDMIHIRGLSLDGRLGQSTVYLARQTIGLALASEKYGAKFFGNGAVPRGILELPGTLEPRALETLRRSWAEAHGGENAHKTAILERGVKYTAIGVKPEEAQMSETQEKLRLAIASIFNVPPHMLGLKEAAKSSVEQTGIEFVTYCLKPWLDKFEQEIKRKAFTGRKDRAFFAKFDTRPLLYPSAETRANYYKTGKNWGYLSTNDIREMEDMNPVEDGSGDLYWMPTNMQDAANPLTAPHIGGAQNMDGRPVNPELTFGGTPQNKKQPIDKQPLHANESPRTLPKIFLRLFRDGYSRAASRRALDSKAFKACLAPALEGLIDAAGGEQIDADERAKLTNAFLEGMYANFRDTDETQRAELVQTELLRAATTWYEIAQRHNPNHHLQPRLDDGTWHTGRKDFYIGRHGKTDDDDAGRWTGWLPSKVNAQGMREVADTAEKLKSLGIKRIIASPLLRAQQTAQVYATTLGVPMTTDWRLAAVDLGVLAGQDEEENQHKLDMYVENPDVKIPGGESIGNYVRRSQEGIDEAYESNEETGPILVVTHSSELSSYLQKRLGKSMNLDHASSVLSPAGVIGINGKKITVIAGTYGSNSARALPPYERPRLAAAL